MREFEIIEKNIIKEMIDIDNTNSLNVLSNILERKSVDFFNCGITFYLQIQNLFLKLNSHLQHL